MFFVDTSAVVKRYLAETGSGWVKSWIEPENRNEIIISALTTVEIVSVIARREQEGFITLKNRITMLDDFLLHVEQEYLVIPLDDPLLEQARNLLG